MAYYDLRKKPSLTTKEGETEVLYPEIVHFDTISAEKLVKYTVETSGFRQGEIEGILSSLLESTIQYLNMGYRVEFGDFGYFSGKIKANRLVEKKSDIRSGSIRFNDVNFRPSKQFKRALNGELTRVPQFKVRTSSDLPQEELERRLLAYLDKHGFINRVAYSNITGRLKWKATQDLNGFVERGLIERKGYANRKYYVRAEK